MRHSESLTGKILVQVCTFALIGAMAGCADSERMTRVEAACVGAGRLDPQLCRCIAEGADKSQLSDAGIRWLAAQFAADPDDDRRIERGTSEELTLAEYLNFSHIVLEPELLCDGQV